MTESNAIKPVTTTELARMKRRGQVISMLTAYDFPTAKILDEAGTDVLLVGDSLAMVVQGHSTTLPVTLDQMIYHAEMVGRAAKRALTVVDLPFPEGQLSIERTVMSAARILKETACRAVKLEGGAEQAGRIAAMVSAGIPVMAHVGLRPQSVHVTGGYRVQRDAQQLIQDAQAAEAAGAFSVLVECVTSDLAAQLTQSLNVPTIGIGAGPHVDGQVLVTHDLLGISAGYVPKFAKKYLDLKQEITEATRQYIADIRSQAFPGSEHQFN
jgi:3-methyl-2-oxobutanoate hydroxymethyltransferase